MKKILALLFLFPLLNLSSLEIGAGLSFDYFNNPVEDSATSPIQNRPIVFHNFTIGYFNLRSGIGAVTSEYEIHPELKIPVFNDYYKGFRTVEIDVYTSPGILFSLNQTVSLGLSGGIGARLPIISEVMDIERAEADLALDWFYKEMRFLFWQGSIFSYIKAYEKVSFYTGVEFKHFLFREDQWTIGATVGILWQ